jgi:endonuclease V-like protein UPF0215 family
VKPGVRALGIAESYRGESSTLAGVVCRASRVVDGFVFGSCTVGGQDGTAAAVDLYERLGREDIQYILIAGIAPAWYNVVDLSAVHEAVDRPVLSVSFEESRGLEPAIREAFDGEAADQRIETYEALPDREQVIVDDETLYVRGVGIEDAEAAEVVRAFTPEGGRPEPLRVARLAARAADHHAGE